MTNGGVPMSRRTLSCCLTAALLAAMLASNAQGEEQLPRARVYWITLDNQVINPVEARFIARSLRQASSARAQCLVIQLDTPGGLLESTRRIVKDMLQSDVPVVVYIAPSGARAGSAGVFLTLAAHVAVMAPGTNIGAAHPVNLGGAPPGLPPDQEKHEKANPVDPMSEKIVNDTVAWARALAAQRGRNAEWAARAVKESISAPASEALEQHVIDFLAANQRELLDGLDGREISLPDRVAVLHTRGAVVERLEMSWSERLLDVLANPTLAYLLLLVGVAGVLFEITHPGFWAPGIIGLGCLVLAFFALQMLPINYAGLALIGLGLVLLIMEVKVHSLGLLTLAGLVSLLLGSAMLVEPVPGIEPVSWVVAGSISVALALIVLLLVGNVVRSQRAKIRTGMDDLIGAEGRAQGDIDGQGWVFVQGALWRAQSEEYLRAGEAVRIQGYEGLTLHVQRA
jgi:membrane-bound serine protease (ClpP class)